MVFAGSGCLQYRFASVFGQHSQGATKYTKSIYKQCGMEITELKQELFWKQKEKRQNDDAVYKANLKQKRKRNKKIPAVQFKTVKQARQDNKSGKTYSTVVALTDVHEAAAGKDTTKNEQCKHCGHLQIKTIMHIGSRVLYAKWHRIFL